MLAIRGILHPTDFSDSSRSAFDLACSLARDFGAKLVVCHVAPPPVSPVVDGIVLDIPSDEAEQSNWARIKEMKPADADIQIDYRLKVGDAVREIIQLADEENVDLIAMGTHGRGGVSRLLMGSVAEGVMRKAPCPVLTVRSATPVKDKRSTGKQLVTG